MNRALARTARLMLAAAVFLAGLAASVPVRADGDPYEPRAQFDAEHRVEFPGLVPPIDWPRGRPNAIQGYLFRPAGAGPHPAVVLLTACRGLNQFPGYRRWVDRIVSWGYVALVVDSLKTRNVKYCNESQRVDRATTAGDAYGAFQFLAALPDVAHHRIGLIGYSFGATSTMFAIESHPGDLSQRVIAAEFPELAPYAFRAAVAFYPTSLVRRQRFSAPLLILDGDGDRRPKDLDIWWLAESGRRSGDKLEFHIYPSATHGFDMESVPGGWDPEIRFDPVATADAAQRVQRFLEENL